MMQDLNKAFLARADGLERVELATYRYSSDEAALHLLGPMGRLTCLPKMLKVTHLAIEPYMLLDWLNPNTWSRFHDMLPPNLTSLTLRFAPEQGEDLLRIWARSGIGAVLRAAPEKWQAKLPHLSHIRLEPLTFGKATTAVLKKDLADAGIRLTWEEKKEEAVDKLAAEVEKLKVG
jgi:hypothetical protein